MSKLYCGSCKEETYDPNHACKPKDIDMHHEECEIFNSDWEEQTCTCGYWKAKNTQPNTTDTEIENGIKPTDKQSFSSSQKPIWEESFYKVWDNVDVKRHERVKQFISQVEKAAEQRGYERGYDAGLDEVGMERVDKTKVLKWKKRIGIPKEVND